MVIKECIGLVHHDYELWAGYRYMSNSFQACEQIHHPFNEAQQFWWLLRLTARVLMRSDHKASTMAWVRNIIIARNNQLSQTLT